MDVTVTEGWDKHYENHDEQSPKDAYAEQEAEAPDPYDHEALANEPNH